MDIPTAKATQYVISAMQTCEKYNTESNDHIHANFISGYPRNLHDIQDYMTKVNSYLLWMPVKDILKQGGESQNNYSKK